MGVFNGELSNPLRSMINRSNSEALGALLAWIPLVDLDVFTLAPAAIGLALIVVLGRVVLRPLFRMVAKSRGGSSGPELFIALCLLIVVGTGVAAQAAGLSMSIGALIAGLLIGTGASVFLVARTAGRMSSAAQAAHPATAVADDDEDQDARD